MRIRQIKNHLSQIVIVGVTIYLVIYIIQDDPEQLVLAKRYEIKKDIVISGSNQDEADKIASIAERMHDSERKRMMAKRIEPNFINTINQAPQTVMDTIIAQVPGGKDALARGDKVAQDAMQRLFAKYKEELIRSKLQNNQLAARFAKNLFNDQKMIGALPDIRDKPPFYDPKRVSGLSDQDPNLNPLAGNDAKSVMLRKLVEKLDPKTDNKMYQIIEDKLINSGLNSAPRAQFSDGENADPKLLLLQLISGGQGKQDRADNIQAMLDQQQGLNSNLHNNLQPFQQVGTNLNSQGQLLLGQPNADAQYPLNQGDPNLPLNWNGGVNQHALIQVQNLIKDYKGNDGASMEKLKALLDIGAPQQINTGVVNIEYPNAGQYNALPQDISNQGNLGGAVLSDPGNSLLNPNAQMAPHQQQNDALGNIANGNVYLENDRNPNPIQTSLNDQPEIQNGKQKLQYLPGNAQIQNQPNVDPVQQLETNPDQAQISNDETLEDDPQFQNPAEGSKTKNLAQKPNVYKLEEPIKSNEQNVNAPLARLEAPDGERDKGEKEQGERRNDSQDNVEKEEHIKQPGQGREESVEAKVRRSYEGDMKEEKDKERSNQNGLKFMSPQEFEAMIKDQEGGATKQPDFDFGKVRVVVVDPSKDRSGRIINVTKIMTVQEYKLWKPKEYIRMYANPFEKGDIPPTLMPYGPALLRPNPRMLVKDLSMTVQTENIEHDLLIEKKRRIALGDDDIYEIPEVRQEMMENPKGIPNLIHFIWFSCHKYRIHHFLSMKSALKIQRPRLILLHTNCTPAGPYWDEFVTEAGPTLKVVKRTPPERIWTHNVTRVEHQSDVARLQILLEVGGIYMDDDMVILKSLNPLRNNSMVLGEENYDALANSIVLSNRNAWFLRRWYQEYQTFNSSKWSHSSCFVPWSLWMIFPNTVHVVKEKLLRPNWEEIKYIYHELWDWTQNYAIHLYSRFMRALDGTPERSLRELAILNTTYGEISRFILWGGKEPRDITDWV